MIKLGDSHHKKLGHEIYVSLMFADYWDVWKPGFDMPLLNYFHEQVHSGMPFPVVLALKESK